ncbi:GGDEF domain-containing protein [Pontibacterium sp.]|uniref:GGDEF domain-containing protein n=1 Tax=Pontibacterium sp. TaxID=2036026 RepID=UPI003565AC46
MEKRLGSGSDEMVNLKRILNEDLLHPHFQPIVDLRRNEVIGYEALIRGPSGSDLEYPDALFRVAIKQGMQNELELACRRVTLQRYAELRPDAKLFLNISASLLSSTEHQTGFTEELLRELDIPTCDIVIEISEQHPFDHYGLTAAAVQHYRDMGFAIAIDDLGSGYSGLKLWSELRPEYVKIDKHFVSNIDQDPVKKEFVRSICNIAQTMRCNIIAEGIERSNELRALQQLGVTIGQGYLLGRPGAVPTFEPDTFLPDASYWEANAESPQDISDTAFSLLKSSPTLAPDDKIGFVSQLFRQNTELTTIPVLVGGKPIGVVLKSELLEMFSSQYGRALYEHKPVSKMLSQNVLVVESTTTLARVSQIVTDQDEFALKQDIIITQEGSYLGMGSVRDLLKRITELKIRNARYANPLTLLPGNVPINREIDLMLRQLIDFRVAYFDLNNFKPYNDCYGYSKGDQVIRLLGELLNRHASGNHNFVGHIGGDDFVVIYRGDGWQASCERIIKEFEDLVRSFYSPQDLQRKGIEALDRHGEPRFFPLLGLAIGVVHPDAGRCDSHNEVAELASQAKKEAKALPGSAIFVSRRRGGGDLPEPLCEYALG